MQAQSSLESEGEEIIRRVSGSSLEEEKEMGFGEGPEDADEERAVKTKSIVATSKRNLMHELEYIQAVSQGLNIRMSVSFEAYSKNIKKVDKPPLGGVRFMQDEEIKY